MNQQQLKKSINILYDMECHNYMMQKTIQELSQEIDSLGISYRYDEPQRYNASLDFRGNGRLGLCLLFGTIIGVGVGIATDLDPFSFLNASGSSIFAVISCGIVGFFIGILFNLIGALLAKWKQQHLFNRMYNDDMEEYNRRVRENDERVKNELKVRNTLIEKQNELYTRYERSLSELSKYYDIVGIEQEYRNLVPIGCMNDFVRLGICSELTGATGLYYMIRKELQFNQLKLSLDEISQKLDKIMEINKQLHYDLEIMNERCTQLVDATIEQACLVARNNELLEESNRLSRITAYSNERIAKETEYHNFLQSIR